MALFTMRDSWNVWREKVNKAIGNVEEIDADEIVYDNTTSGLTATNVQSAIDEVVSGVGSLDGSDIAYDGTTSGLSATNVQSAIDEIDGDVDTLKTFNSNIPDGYLFMGREMISDTVENGTFSGCLDTIAAHLKTVAHALADDELIMVDTLTLNGNASFIARNDTYTNESTDTNIVGMAVAASSTVYYLWSCIAYSGTGTSTMQHMSYTSGNWAFYDDGASSSGASKVVQCYYKKFKKIK